MPKIKTNELTDAALDWAVAKCEGISNLDERITPEGVRWAGDFFQPSKHWSEGGPIIDREKLCVGYQHQLDPESVPLLDPDTICWARTTAGGYLKYGPTPLIAAMRCYVASKMGDVVEVPEELT